MVRYLLGLATEIYIYELMAISISLAVLARYLPDDEDDKQDARNEIRLAQIQVGGEALKRTLTHDESHEPKTNEGSITDNADASKQDNDLRLRKSNSQRVRERQLSLFDVAQDSPLLKLAEKSLGHQEKSSEQKLQQQFPTSRHRIPQFLHLRYKAWIFLQHLKKYEFKFALKVAIAVSVLCIPAFVPSSRSWFLYEYGQWASVTVSI